MCYGGEKRWETESTFRRANLNSQNHIVLTPTHSKSLLFIKSSLYKKQLSSNTLTFS